MKNILLIAVIGFVLSACQNKLVRKMDATIPTSTVTEAEVGVVQLTKGERQHWFGYYDKQQIDPTGRYALGCEVDHFFRSPTPQDTVRIGIIDLKKNNKWTEIATSTAWSWQQGCMLQWIPGSKEEIIWNDRVAAGFVSRIYNLKTKTIRTLPKAIYTLSPDGNYALCVDFDRLQFFRPGYGYATKEKQQNWEKAPTDKGIYKMDLKTGESELILSYAQIAQLKRAQGDVSENFHWFNHLLINPDGTRFIFLNRSRPLASNEEMTAYIKNNPDPKKRGFSGRYITRALTADVDGSDVFALNDSGQFSHFIWKGTDEICAWAVPDDGDKTGFFDFKDKTKQYQTVGNDKMTRNGHNTYIPNTNYEWILNDTYPLGKDRLQELYLYHIPTDRKVILGKFHEPIKYKGEWRCDLHPRSSQDGRFVIFDSTHGGNGREIYKIDISEIVF